MDGPSLERLADLSQQLLETPGAEEALSLLVRCALPLFQGDHVSLRLCADDGTLRSAARAGVGSLRPAPDFRVGQGVMGWVAETGRAARVDDALREPRFDARHRFRIGSLLSVPVTRERRVLGVLSISAARPHAFGRSDEVLAQLLASAAAQALHRAELTQLAMTDPQTFAYSPRCLLPRLREEMERALRHTQPLSLLLIDLDHFKQVNDRHGHAAGDAVLRACADRARECVRAADVLIRRGGEEFVLIMPATDLRNARAVAERVRARLADRPLSVADGRELTQTASIGVATWDGRESAEALEERADRAMYAAKRAGRNRVHTSRSDARGPKAWLGASSRPRQAPEKSQKHA